MQDIPKDILSQAARGDMKSFEQIYNAASGFVYGIALRITNNSADAQEVTQDVFIKIYKNLKNFRFHSSFKTWAYRIAVNTAINRYRQTSRDMRRSVPYDPEIEVEDVEDKTAYLIDKEEAEKRVASLLSALNPEQRACIILKEIEGLSYQEIADTLKININTVRSRLKRARTALLMRRRKEAGKHEL